MTVPTVAMMPKKKRTARPTAKKTSRKKRVYGIDAGYTYPKQCIDELLKLAGNSRPQSRRELAAALQLAQLAYDDERERRSRERPPPKQIEQFENSIEKTLTLLRSIREYKDWRNIGFVTQQIGRGVVAVGLAQGLPRNPSISDQRTHFSRVRWPSGSNEY